MSETPMPVKGERILYRHGRGTALRAPRPGETAAPLNGWTRRSDAPGYRGCGLDAWRRAAERLTAPQIAVLPGRVREMLDAVHHADLAGVVSATVSPQTPAQRHDMDGRPAASSAVTYYWNPDGYWTTPYGQQRYSTFADVLAVWNGGAE